MTAIEVISQIKRLSPDEQAQVVDFVQHLNIHKNGVRYVDDKTFEESKNKIIEENTELLKKLAQ